MYNVVISFHASMSQTDWRGRRLTSLFPGPGTQTLFIDGGSTFPCKALKTNTPTTAPDCPAGKATGYNDLIRWPASVPRSPSDPKYVAGDPSTHTRSSRLQGFVEHFYPNLHGQRYRVAIIGFSEGCGGVGAFLKTTDVGYIDTVVAIDGVHWGKPSVCPDGSECLRKSAAPWMNFAALAAFGRSPDNPTIAPGSRCMVMTNSDTPPPACCRQSKFASQYIAGTVLRGICSAGQPPCASLPPGMWRTTEGHPVTWGAGTGRQITYNESQNDWYAAWGGLWILSYANIDRAGSGHYDHIYQSKVVMPLVIEKIVVPRWNASTGGTAVGV